MPRLPDRIHQGAIQEQDALSAGPAGVIAFPGSGITANVIEKAKAKRIPVKEYGGAP